MYIYIQYIRFPSQRQISFGNSVEFSGLVACFYVIQLMLSLEREESRTSISVFRFLLSVDN